MPFLCHIHLYIKVRKLSTRLSPNETLFYVQLFIFKWQINIINISELNAVLPVIQLNSLATVLTPPPPPLSESE